MLSYVVAYYRQSVSLSSAILTSFLGVCKVTSQLLLVRAVAYLCTLWGFLFFVEFPDQWLDTLAVSSSGILGFRFGIETHMRNQRRLAYNQI